MNNLNHLAFIMDGNGRWAKQHGLQRINGHNKGLKAMKEIINECLSLNIPTITFFAFSTENWNRPKQEVNFLINLLKKEIDNPKLLEWLNTNNVRFIWNGFSDNLDEHLINKINHLQRMTSNNTKMNLQILFNYGSQQKIVSACNNLINANIPITISSLKQELDPFSLGEIDLLIRTSGEQRISNCLLFEIAYSEFIFNKKYWPEYTPNDLKIDLQEFNNRQRRYGKI